MSRKADDICYNGRRVRIRKGWDEAGKEGIALSEPLWVEQEWLPVHWDGEGSPSFFRLSGIEIIPPDDWKTQFAREFHEHYDGILTPEIIEGSIQWHIKFMGKYIK